MKEFGRNSQEEEEEEGGMGRYELGEGGVCKNST